MTVELVDGGADDLDDVMRVMAAAFADRYGEAWTRSQCAGILPMTGVRLVLARDEERVVGFALFRTVADDSELLLIAVDPAAQGRGVGRELLSHFIGHSRTNGAERIHLEVRDGNPAIEIYKSAGFAQANRRRNYYRGRGGGEFDALTFVLAVEN
ncbi:MAG TPA: ribosomal protein S18-alanine N-acetyltransferase [Sphingomicrobium sp.]|nr:ribosomal protein S18-alanine N-acetyltransferase [Sphingomicrobium sp.]